MTYAQDGAMISGKILSTEKEIVDFATVYLKGTNYGGTTNKEGIYHLKAPAGNYTLVVSNKLILSYMLFHFGISFRIRAETKSARLLCIKQPG